MLDIAISDDFSRAGVAVRGTASRGRHRPKALGSRRLRSRGRTAGDVGKP